MTAARDGADNMALDDALMTHARDTAECVVRVYAWSAPTLSFGRNQRAAGLYAPETLAAHGLAVVRRPTGGRAVLHHREITYAVAAPIGALAPAGAPLAVAYARINRWLVAALRSLGAGAREAVPTARAPRPEASPCFETPTGGELVVDVDDRVAKLVGSAQWQHDGALLQHGSILIDDDQSLVASLSTTPALSIPAPATLRALLGRAPALREVADAIGEAIAAIEGARPTPLALDDRLCATMRAARDRYRDPAWTWRR